MVASRTCILCRLLWPCSEWLMALFPKMVEPRGKLQKWTTTDSRPEWLVAAVLVFCFSSAQLFACVILMTIGAQQTMATNSIPNLAHINGRREKNKKGNRKTIRTVDNACDSDIGRESSVDKKSSQFMYPSRTHSHTHAHIRLHYLYHVIFRARGTGQRRDAAEIKKKDATECGGSRSRSRKPVEKENK